MANDVLIRVDGVGKKFCRDLRTSLRYGVQDLTSEVFGRPRTHELRPKEFWAVEDVSFELRRGESLALVGHNGAGKTTLLKMLNGLVKPDRGRVEMYGSVAAMIALGAGFNPILTGRENIYINAAVLGLNKRQVDDRIDEVIAFSEIGEFIDSPVRNYSSGMNVRLGFSVAALLLKPDILLLDEILAVGDLAFRIKSLNHMRSIMADCAVIFVSHSMPTISSFCTRAILMDHGRVKSEPDEDMGAVIQKYVALAPVKKFEEGDPDMHIVRFFSKGVQVTHPVPVKHGDRLELEALITIEEESDVSLVVLAEGTLPLIHYRLGSNSSTGEVFAAGQHRVQIDLGTIDLSPARYTIDVVIKSTQSKRTKRIFRSMYLEVEHHFRSWAHMMRAAPMISDPSSSPQSGTE
jgi:lipopolysaccharide transport system ATP-binding protein